MLALDRPLPRIPDADAVHGPGSGPGLGYPEMVIDSSGNPVWTSDHLPFGETVNESGSAFDPLLRYPGQWAVPEAEGLGLTQLFYNGYRWYRPDWGRYSQADPLGRFGEVHGFAYARNNPLLFLDPLGLQSMKVCCNKWDEFMIPIRIGQVGALQTGMLNSNLPLPPPATSNYPTGVTFCVGHQPHAGGSPSTNYQNFGNGKCADACTRVHEQVHRNNCRSLGYDDPPYAVPGYDGVDFDEGFAYLAEYGCLKEALLEGQVTVDVDPINERNGAGPIP